jgi:hypothetical protein
MRGDCPIWRASDLASEDRWYYTQGALFSFWGTSTYSIRGSRLVTTTQIILPSYSGSNLTRSVRFRGVSIGEPLPLITIGANGVQRSGLHIYSLSKFPVALLQSWPNTSAIIARFRYCFPARGGPVSPPAETALNIFAFSARLTRPFSTRFRSSPHPRRGFIFHGDHFKSVRNSGNSISPGDHAGSRACRGTRFQSQTKSQLLLSQPALPAPHRLTSWHAERDFSRKRAGRRGVRPEQRAAPKGTYRNHPIRLFPGAIIKSCLHKSSGERPMSTEPLFAKISSLRSETQRLCKAHPSAELLSRLEACDAALRYLRGTTQESVRRESLHGNLRLGDNGWRA